MCTAQKEEEEEEEVGDENQASADEKRINEKRR